MSRGVQLYCDDCLVPMTERHLLVEYLLQFGGAERTIPFPVLGGRWSVPSLPDNEEDVFL